MSRATEIRQLIVQVCQESAPVEAPPKPTTTPVRRPERRPRPGTKPWKIPSIRPGEETAPKGYFEAEDLSDWISEWAQLNGSAVEIWGTAGLHRQIKAAADGGKKVRARTFPSNDSIHAKIAAVKDAGWREIARDENIEDTEVIFVK